MKTARPDMSTQTLEELRAKERDARRRVNKAIFDKQDAEIALSAIRAEIAEREAKNRHEADQALNRFSC